MGDGCSGEAGVPDEAHPPGDLLRTPDLQALTLLDGADEVAGGHEVVDGAGVQPGRTAGQDLDLEVTALQVGAVDVGDLQFAAGRGLQRPGDVDHVRGVEVQPGHCVVRLRLLRLLLQRGRRTVGGEGHHTVGRGVAHPVGEDGATVDLVEAAQLGAQTGTVEDVVTEDQRHRLIADEVRPEDERLGQPVRLLLHGVLDGHPELGTVAEQASELVVVLGGRDDEDLADAGEHQGGQRVVDHRLVVDRHELLRHTEGDRTQPRPGAAGEDDAAHHSPSQPSASAVAASQSWRSSCSQPRHSE